MERKYLAKVGTSLHRAILKLEYVGPALRSTGDHSWLCPFCDQVLLEKIGRNQVFDVVIICGACRKTSQTPHLPPGAVIKGRCVHPGMRAVEA